MSRFLEWINKLLRPTFASTLRPWSGLRSPVNQWETLTLTAHAQWLDLQWRSTYQNDQRLQSHALWPRVRNSPAVTSPRFASVNTIFRNVGENGRNSPSAPGICWREGYLFRVWKFCSGLEICYLKLYFSFPYRPVRRLDTFFSLRMRDRLKSFTESTTRDTGETQGANNRPTPEFP